jgi:phosphoribosyl-AMP cyclohydrolase
MKNISINFSKRNSLVPTIIQDYQSGIVYMLGFMNEEAFNKTKETGLVYFWSRSRACLWMKGEKSGNVLKVKEILVDCDNDALLIKAKLDGENVCHTGNITCFYTQLKGMYET